MHNVRLIPRTLQRNESWANGTGSTTVILREPDDANWRVRVSVAKVDHDGPFSNLPDTRRTLVPLDASMILRFPDGRQANGARFTAMQFDGSPAPTGLLLEGPTRDFNLMLRGGARADTLPVTLGGALPLSGTAGMRWLAWLLSGQASLRTAAGSSLALPPGDAALVAVDGDTTATMLNGVGEIILVRLYA